MYKDSFENYYAVYLYYFEMFLNSGHTKEFKIYEIFRCLFMPRVLTTKWDQHFDVSMQYLKPIQTNFARESQWTMQIWLLYRQFTIGLIDSKTAPQYFLKS